MALTIKLASSAAKYLSKLDKATRRRIVNKLTEIADNPFDLRLSYPLQGTGKRSSRVGDYRILFEVDQTLLTVAEIGPRGQIYRRI